MPYKLDNFKCQIVFVDPNVGEFQHEIIGEVLLPDPQEDLKINTPIYVDTLSKYDFSLTFKNPNIVNLRKKVE